MRVKRLIKSTLLLAFALSAVGSTGSSGNSGPSCPNGGHRQSGCRNGSYTLTLVGSFRGTGVAEVDDDDISITAALRAGASGPEVRLDARSLQVAGPYFAGTGTVGSTPVRICGRIDRSRSSRLSATFITETGEAGRIVGLLPSDTVNPGWHGGSDDDDDDDDDEDHR